MGTGGYANNNTDCNNNSGIDWRYRYFDSDSDGYGFGNKVCVGNQTGYADNNTDCYDSNANAKPGQTSYFTTNRGDKSFDYNCNDGSIEKQYTGGAWVSATPLLFNPSYVMGSVCNLINPSYQADIVIIGKENMNCGQRFTSCGTSNIYYGEKTCSVREGWYACAIPWQDQGCH